MEGNLEKYGRGSMVLCLAEAGPEALGADCLDDLAGADRIGSNTLS